MLSRDDNELLSRVGPDTPMGTLFREFWVPGGLSSELPVPDGAPLRLRLLGENLIAYRTTSGKVGLMQESCPHRGASMFFGRNEEEGLRCVYHGWKFDVEGNCVDMPNEPAESNFKHKIKATSYLTHERNGILWVYMGPRQATPPALPDLEPNMLPEGRYVIQAYQRECNWMQALEGDIDTCHTGFLHLGSLTLDDAPANTWAKYALGDRAPRYEVVETDFGTMYGTYRPAEEDTLYWRFAAFLFPFYAMTPTGVLGLEVRVRAWVPIDDSHTLALSINQVTPRRTAQVAGQIMAGKQRIAAIETLPNGTGWHDRFRCVANAANDFQIDREEQSKGVSYTGINAIFLQDQAVTESMGHIYNRTNERLGTSDMMIIRTRKRLIDAAKALRDKGALPEAVDNPKVYGVRTGAVVLPKEADWMEATAHLRAAFTDHPELSRDILGGIPAV